MADRRNIKISSDTYERLNQFKAETESWDGCLDRLAGYERSFAPVGLRLVEGGVSLSSMRRGLEMREKDLEIAGTFFDDVLTLLETLAHHEPTTPNDVYQRANLNADIEGDVFQLFRILKEEGVVDEIDESGVTKYRLKAR